MQVADVWTKQDEEKAFSEGYGLFELDSGVYHIQKLDESKVFESDLDAFDHVERLADRGCLTAQKAYALDGQPYPV